MFAVHFGLVGLFLAFGLYPMMVSEGMNCIKVFSDTTSVTTYSSLYLTGGLIMVCLPFVDVLILFIQVWRGKITFE